MNNQLKQTSSHKKNHNYHFLTLNSTRNKHIVFQFKNSPKMKAQNIFNKIHRQIQSKSNKSPNKLVPSQPLNKSSNDFIDPSNDHIHNHQILDNLKQLQKRQENNQNRRLKSAMNVSSNSLASSQGFANQNLWNNFNEMNRKISKCMLTKKIIQNDEKAIQMISSNFQKQSTNLKTRINNIYSQKQKEKENQKKGRKRELYNSSSSPKFTQEFTKEQNVDLINIDLDQNSDQFRMVNSGYFQKDKMLNQQRLLKHSDFRGLLIPKVDNSMFKVYNYGYFHKQLYQNSLYVNKKFKKINQLQKQDQIKEASQQLQKINQLIDDNDNTQIDKDDIKDLNNSIYSKKKLFPNKFLDTLIDQYCRKNN